MAECRAYVNAIDDYQIETVGAKIVGQDTIIALGTREGVKSLLTEFLFRCEDEALKGKSDLLQFLRAKCNYRQAAQAQLIG